jgi:glutathione S-transferase
MGLRRTTTPILLLPSGTVVQGSSEILDHAGLGASDPALEQRCVERIGPLIRQFIYAATLRRAGSGVAAALVEGVSPGQAQAARLLWPLTRQLMAAGMQARPKLLPRLTQQIEIELAWLAGRLSSREDHGFDRSALTAASLLAPLAVPDECPVSPLYRRVQLPEEIGQIVERWRGEPVLVWVRQTYRMHRNRAS